MGHEEAVFHQPNTLFCQQKEAVQQVERVPADDSAEHLDFWTGDFIYTGLQRMSHVRETETEREN